MNKMNEPIGNRLQFSINRMGDVQNRLAFLSWAIEQVQGERVIPDHVFFGLSKELDSLSDEIGEITLNIDHIKTSVDELQKLRP